MAANLRDVAELAGVSIKTVSNVVNDYVHVRPATRARVQRAIEELGYQPNLSARNLRAGRTNVISLVVPELGLSYFAQLADAVIERADRHGLTVQVEQTNGDRDREIAMLSSPRRTLADGLIFSPLGMSQADQDYLTVNYPMVILGERIFGGPVDHVTMRNTEGAYAATRLLTDSGRSRVAVIGAHEHEVIGSAGLRLEGYKQALHDSGLEFDPALVAHSGLWHRSNGAEAMTELIESGADFDGVFAMNDALALGAMRVLQHSGRRIPDDVALVGFDNVEEAEFAVPGLTTIDPGRDAIATRAVDVLAERITGGGGDAVREDLVDFAVILRESH